MKKLSDFKDEEAIELYADLLEPLTEIMSDPEVKDVYSAGKPAIMIASVILKKHKKEAAEILKRIDSEPIDGVNLAKRIVEIIIDIGKDKDIQQTFFVFAEQEKQDGGYSGSATENIEG